MGKVGYNWLEFPRMYIFFSFGKRMKREKVFEEWNTGIIYYIGSLLCRGPL
jgi:hypothetical protein